VAELASQPRRVLVCTDCLSEGINLQQHFDAVVHYDLSWNPTRHEQREGRIDRFGQPQPRIKVITYYGTDTQIDGVVLEVLLRKHQQIRRSLGVSIPLPGNTEQLVQAVMQGWLLRGKKKEEQRGLFDEELGDEEREVLRNWDNVSEREKRSRTMFARGPGQPDRRRGASGAGRNARRPRLKRRRRLVHPPRPACLGGRRAGQGRPGADRPLGAGAAPA
jgi:superfamily II DNA/RNA helicase